MYFINFVNKAVPHRSLWPGFQSAALLLSLSSTSPSAQCIPSCSSPRQGCWLHRASAPSLLSIRTRTQTKLIRCYWSHFFLSRGSNTEDFFFFLPTQSQPFSMSCQTKQTHTVSDLSKHLFVDGKGKVQHVFYVIVLHPLKGLVKLLVQILQVTQVTWTTQWQMRVCVSAYPLVFQVALNTHQQKKNECVLEYTYTTLLIPLNDFKTI